MKKQNRAEIDDVLLDVRKSYRTLYAYQRMVMDLAKYIGDRMSFSYTGGWPVFSDPSPGAGKGQLNRWAWDWLNMYHYDFHYATSFQSGIKFSVEIISDTGFWLSRHEGVKKRDLDRYEAPENSGTKLLFIIGKDVWKPGLTRDVFDKMKTLLSTSATIVESIDDGIMLFHVFDLKDFLNADDTDRQLNSFISLCCAHGITLPQLSAKI